MRPGQLCPGKAVIGDYARAVASRFNEAGAVMPRKAPTPPVAGAGAAGRFNEAGAVMPRKAEPGNRPATVADNDLQ